MAKPPETKRGHGTGSREALIPALALAGREPEAREEARIFLAGNPDWKIGEVVANTPFIA
jgi:hypothetical protein